MRRQLGGSLSTGELMRLSSLLKDSQTGLLSLAAAEQMRASEPQRESMRLSAASTQHLEPLTTSGSVKETTGSGSWFQGGKVSARSSMLVPLRKKTVCSPDLWRDSLDLSEAPRHNVGVSPCTKRQNWSQELVNGRLESSQSVAKNKVLQGDKSIALHDPLVLESPRSRKQNIDMIKAEFKDEVTAMESQIADIGKSLQMGRLSKDEIAEAKLQEERESEKRRREVEQRKARLKEKNARDPHRKIQLRLENRRRFEMDTLDQAGIPTTDFVYQSDRGCEKIKGLVDVQALRSKCQGMSEGIHSVDKLIELKQRKETPFRMTSPGSISMPGLNCESIPSGEVFPRSRGRLQRPSSATRLA